MNKYLVTFALVLGIVLLHPLVAHADTYNCSPSNFNGSGYFGCQIVLGTSTTVAGAGALGMTGQNGGCILYWNSPDTPEGSQNYVMQVGAGGGCDGSSQTGITGTANLPNVLPPGTYYVFARVTKFTGNPNATITMGGATSNSVAVNRIGFIGPMTLTAVSSASVISFNSVPNPALVTPGDFQDFALREITLTTNSNVIVDDSKDPEGVLVDLTVPSVDSNTAQYQLNWVPNSSFETGIDNTWGVLGGRTDLMTSWIDSTGADCHSGNRCLKIPLDASFFQSIGLGQTAVTTELQSKVFHLEANKVYSPCVWMRAASNDAANLSITFSWINTYAPPAGISPGQYVKTVTQTANNTWQQWCITPAFAQARPSSDFLLQIELDHQSAGNFLFIDDVSLLAGTSTTYVASHNVETQIIFDDTNKPGHIFFTTDSLAAIQLNEYNATGGTLAKQIDYTIYDYNNAVVATRTKSISVASGFSSSDTINIGVGSLTGHFRVVYCIDGEEQTCKEEVFAVIPATTTSVCTGCYFGTHPNYTTYQTKTFQRLGFKWFHDLSPGGAQGRWCLVNPSMGVYDYDDSASIAISNNMTNVFNIGAFPPTWAVSGGAGCSTGGTFSMSDWSTFVTALATHNKATFGSGLTYEIWNEPFATYSADFYGQILKTANDAIEAVDATAKKMCMGGVALVGDMNSVVTQMGTRYPGYDLGAHCTWFTSHIYVAGQPASQFAPYINYNGGGSKTGNTESGYKTMDFEGPSSNWISWGQQIQTFNDSFRFYEENAPAAPSLIVATIAEGIAAGMNHYDWYDSRQADMPGTYVHQFTFMNRDASIQDKGVAMAIAIHNLDNATGHGNVAAETNSRFFPFTTSGNPVAVLYSQDHHPRVTTLSGTCIANGTLSETDLMGNPITISGTTIHYGRAPIYLFSTCTEAQLQTALTNAVSSDDTDTTPPNVSIAYVPNGTTQTTNQRLRWVAIDNQSYPNYGEVNAQGQPGAGSSDPPNPLALLYSWKLSPLESSFSTYAPTTFKDYNNLPNNTYTLSVMAKDEAGNVSSTVSQTFVVGSPTPPPSNSGKASMKRGRR